MRFSPLRAALVAVLALPAIPLVQCTGAATTPPNSGLIGPGGGALPSTDYAIEITVPPGALTTTLNFTVSPPITEQDTDGGAFNYAGAAYTISACPLDGAVCGPATFLTPAVISYTQEAVAVQGKPFLDPSDFRVVRVLVDGGIVPLANQSVDSVAQTIEGTTTEVTADTTFGVVALAVTGSPSCATVSQTNSSGDAGCDPVVIVPGKCSAYVGAVTKSCTVSGATIGATCCYPDETPRCFTQQETDCSSPCKKIPGSTVQACTTLAGDDDAGSSTSQSTCCLAATAQVTCTAAAGSECSCANGWLGSCSNLGGGSFSATCCSATGTSPPGDAGADAGASDAATSDAGTADAGTTGDAGTSPVDAGPVDAGAGNG